MLAVILAAGHGSRLMPLTKEIPKPMLKINEKPFLEYLILQLKRDGITDILICVGHMSEKIIDYFGDGSIFDVKIKYSKSKIMGTAGELKNAENILKNHDNFIVMNGDSIFDVNINELIEFHEKNNSIASVCLRKIKDVHRYGAVIINDEKMITNFSEKSINGVGLINAGIYVINNKVFDLIPSGTSSIEKDIFPQIINQDGLFGTLKEGFFIDIGTPDDYKRAQNEIKKVVLW